MPLRSSPQHYGSVAVTIHWLTAGMILVLMTTGFLAAGQVDDGPKAALLKAHVPFGVAVLALTMLRIVWWRRVDARPDYPVGQPRWQRLMAGLVHYGLYAVVLATAVSGIAIVALSGALPAVFRSGMLPDFTQLPPRAVHGILPRLMLLLLALHVAAALYHQFVLRDHLLAQMGLGRTQTRR